MFPKKSKKRINMIMIASIVGIGNYSYIPTAFAESTVVVQENESWNTLSNLQIEGVKLNRDFTTDVKEYSANVDNQTKEMTLLVESSNPDSVITINDTSIKSGIASTFSLQTGENKFLITVTNGTHPANTYTLTVTRKQNANNLLKNIELSNGKLTPVFSSDVSVYDVEVANDVPSLTITPTAAEPTSSIQVNGSNLKGDSTTEELPVGKTVILIVVTAENGEKRTYTLNVTRDGSSILKSSTASQNNRTNSFLPTMNQQSNSSVAAKVSKATLSSLTVNVGTWDSAFSANEFTYHVAVDSNVDSITIAPKANYSNSTILIEGSTSKTIKLDDDNKTVISVVVSYSDDDRKTYVLVIDRKA
ncbi:MAG: cadherin-like beta sandwich domain-containing protein [Bacillus sp. (in: firmicutes)]